MNHKRQFTPEFKKEAVALVTEQGYTIARAVASLGISNKTLHTWVSLAREQSNGVLSDDECAELKRLQKENKELRTEKEIPKKGECLLRETYVVRDRFILDNATDFSVRTLCRVMRVTASAWYAWRKKPAEPLQKDVEVRVRLKALFAASRQGAGSRTLVKRLRGEGIIISRWRVRKLMQEEGLVCRQRRTYKVTTKPHPVAEVAPNLLNQNFNPPGPNQVWASDITYLKTGEGWLYLAAIMDLYSRLIVGWQVDRRMTSSLVCGALMKAYNLRTPPPGLVVHTDRGAQYTGQRFQALLSSYRLRSSMGDVGACWDNAVMERFWGSLKHEWLLLVPQPTRAYMEHDVATYIRYYNLDRHHAANGDLSPVRYEQMAEKKVS
ncbi:IS3 family transposase [Symbiopectobacterium purcellii]|uniref:IS3 family transposase n=1 Tax=Symbiopectobacterium purcellii TaxID=2871826 RepID=UPI003F862496